MIEVPEDHFNKNDMQNVNDYKYAMYLIAFYILAIFYTFLINWIIICMIIILKYESIIQKSNSHFFII